MTVMIDLSNHLYDFQEAVIVERQQNGREESSAGVTSMTGCAAYLTYESAAHMTATGLYLTATTGPNIFPCQYRLQTHC